MPFVHKGSNVQRKWISGVKNISIILVLVSSLSVSCYLWHNQTHITPIPDRYFNFEQDLPQLPRNVYPTKRTALPHQNSDPIQIQSDQGLQEPHRPPLLSEKQDEVEALQRQILVDEARKQGLDMPAWLQDDNSRPAFPQNRIFTLGTISNDSNARYAVFSTTTSNREALGFAFYMPLTVLAWKRIGYGSIVIIVGSAEDWYADEVLHWTLSCAVELGAFIVFLEPREERSVMISQISRIFVANILNATNSLYNDPYIVTSDTDLWPFQSSVYDLPKDKSIIALNSECCGTFSHRGQSYKMVPMANIGMYASTWRKVTTKLFLSPSTTEDIITFIFREFGNVAFEKVRKGENLGWFLDQRMASVLIQDWNSLQPYNRLLYVPRDVGRDRIDREGWNPQTLEGKVDAHLLDTAYIPGIWVQIRHLLELMYGPDSEKLSWCDTYYSQFQRLFLKQFREKSSSR